jgi:hypothetical protein
MKKNLFLISESERERILGMHKDATRKQYLSEQTQYIKDAAGKVSVLQGPQVAPQGSTVITQQEYETALKAQQLPANQPVASATTPAPAAVPAPAAAPASTAIDFKSMGFKDIRACKATPPYQVAPKAKMTLVNAQKQWKGFNCNGSKNCQQGSAPFNIELVSALCDGSFSKLMAPAPILNAGAATATTATTQGATTATTTPQAVTGGGGAPQLALGAIGEAQKLMPNIKNLDPQKQTEVANWAKSPAGKYILALPAQQREAGLDNLEKRRGDETTRNLKKDIRTALGMAADTRLGRLGQGIQGAVQGYQQGVQGNVPPQQ